MIENGKKVGPEKSIVNGHLLCNDCEFHMKKKYTRNEKEKIVNKKKEKKSKTHEKEKSINSGPQMVLEFNRIRNLPPGFAPKLLRNCSETALELPLERSRLLFAISAASNKKSLRIRNLPPGFALKLLRNCSRMATGTRSSQSSQIICD